jgi:hypothetical protein
LEGLHGFDSGHLVYRHGASGAVMSARQLSLALFACRNPHPALSASPEPTSVGIALTRSAHPPSAGRALRAALQRKDDSFGPEVPVLDDENAAVPRQLAITFSYTSVAPPNYPKTPRGQPCSLCSKQRDAFLLLKTEGRPFEPTLRSSRRRLEAPNLSKIGWGGLTTVNIEALGQHLRD